MAIVSMALSSPFPALASLNHRRHRDVNMAFASLSQETTSSGVQITEGTGKLPKVLVKSVHGSEAEIYLFGGCITSWKVSNGRDLLFVRPDAVFNGKKPISGGIPHCFPQFGPGPMQQVEEIPDEFPFQIQDIPGEQTISLIRQYNGEIIKVEVHIPDLVTGDDNNVSVSTILGPTLEFNCTAYANKVAINNLSVREREASEDQIAHEGPDFSDPCLIKLQDLRPLSIFMKRSHYEIPVLSGGHQINCHSAS